MEKEKQKIFKFCFLYLCLIILIQSFLPALARKAKTATLQNQYQYEQKILRKEEKEKYQRSLLPQSGHMTTEEYEELSKDIPNSKTAIPPPKPAKDVQMKYVPQPTYKLARYNNPPGSVELHILRRYKFDRQINCSGITSPQKDIMVYPVVYYYAINQCSAGDLFVIPLDKSLPDVERILRANIVKKFPEPILSTEKNIQEKSTFRTMTPIDFSPNGSKLIAKEKIGNVYDGIWKTNLWVYDFSTKQAKEITEIRDAIKFYWKNTKGLVLDEKRWDILPLGFDAANPDRIIVSAYGYTGKKPKFLGNWSVDYKGERTMLVSLFEAKADISMSGLKLVQNGIINPQTVIADEKKQKKEIKQNRKTEKKAKKSDKKQKKQAYKKTLKEMKQEEHAALREYQQRQKTNAPTGLD